jgi:putative tryptophan/tyrosine transport system substrate-binding protein
MKRREFITLLGGSVAAWPLAARAQQGERMRRLAVLGGGNDRNLGDPRSGPNVAAFLQALQQLGWTDGRNVRIDYRWPAADADKARTYAAELIALAPDVILAVSPSSLVPLLQATRTVPIVFVAVSDPVGAGLVDSLARPGGNATGFMVFEYDLSGKWLELLKEIMPGVTRAAVLRNSAIPTEIGQFAVIQSVSRLVGVEVSPLNLPDSGDIEPALATFASRGNSGLIVAASSLSLVHRQLIVALAARHKLPAVYWEPVFAAAGGLICYGPDRVDQFRQAAGYVDRILKGEKPADLPVQAPTKYQLIINLKTAKALGLTVPPSVLARADEVIE